jgi:transcriptional regulator with XRE-family HTH domain
VLIYINGRCGFRLDIDIGLLIRDLRKNNGHTLKELSKRVNFDYSNLSKIERGERKPTFELLESLSQLYDVPMSYFFREREESKVIDAKWYTVIKESEDKGYTPKELEDIIKLVENIRNRK